MFTLISVVPYSSPCHRYNFHRPWLAIYYLHRTVSRISGAPVYLDWSCIQIHYQSWQRDMICICCFETETDVRILGVKCQWPSRNQPSVGPMFEYLVVSISSYQDVIRSIARSVSDAGNVLSIRSGGVENDSHTWLNVSTCFLMASVSLLWILAWLTIMKWLSEILEVSGSSCFWRNVDNATILLLVVRPDMIRDKAERAEVTSWD